METILFDRSRHEAFEKCPRLRLLAYEVPFGEVNGIEHTKHAIPLLTGGMVHKAIQFFLLGYGEDAAVENALQGYDAEVQDRGIELDELAKEAEWTVKVQRALIEALVRGWIRLVWPRINEEFDILEVEHEERYVVRDSPNGLEYVLLARTDVLTQRKADGNIYVRNFKTASEASDRRIAQFRYDTQTISEVIAVEQRLDRKISGVIYDLLVKQPRKVQYPRDGGNWHNASPLVWCYYNESQSSTDLPAVAAKWEYQCTEPHMMYRKTCPGGANHTLGKGWERRLVTDIFSNGILDWFAWLEENEPQLLRDQFVTIPAIERTDFDIATWHRCVLPEEYRVYQAAEVARHHIRDKGSLVDALPILDELFPKHTQGGNCLFPSKCPMFEICWGAASGIDDPTETDLYQQRTPNHPEGIIGE